MNKFESEENKCPNINPQAIVPLSFVAKGSEVILVSLGENIDIMQKERLMAYGLTTNRKLLIERQKPMTIIFADELEIAIENEVARDIWVRPLE